MSSPTEEFVVRRRRIELSAAQTIEAEGIVFTHLRVNDASDSAANVSLIVANLDNPGIKLVSGRRLKNWPIRSGKVWFTNTAQAGKWIELEYWGGPPIGPPEIVDEGIVHTFAGEVTADTWTPRFDAVKLGATAFLGGMATQHLNFSHAQVWNQAGSGVDVAVQRWKIGTSLTSFFRWGRYAAALTTLHGATSHLDKLDLVNTPPLAELRSQNKGAADFGSLDYPQVQVLANTNELFEWPDPIVLEPGNGLGVMAVTANSTIGHVIQWREKVRP